MVWSHQIIPPAKVRPNINVFLNSTNHSKPLCYGNGSCIFSRLEVLMKWYRNERCETRKIMIFWVFSTKHEILRLFSKKCSGATRSSNQLLSNPCTIISSSPFTLLLKIIALSLPKLFVLTKMCKNPELAQKSG